jgi:DNA-directed RNA polymerase subunit E'/Rpb7|tara:strand:- start:256 stop:1029 length:774 start_codon:yes stop_codon:yes gene_type:complete
MTNIFKKYKINTLINVSLLQLSNDTIDNAVLEKIKEKYENKISKYGYIKEINIIKRSPGIAMKEHFNSSFQFKAICCALICNPSIDTVLKATITSSNNAGFKAEVKDNDKVIIDIIIPKLTAGLNHEYDIQELNINDNIYVKICRKRYHYNDTKIVVIGMVVNDPNIIQDDDPEELVDMIVSNTAITDEIIEVISPDDLDEVDDDELDNEIIDDGTMIDLIENKESTIIDLNEVEPDDDDDLDIDDDEEYDNDYDDD